MAITAMTAGSQHYGGLAKELGVELISVKMAKHLDEKDSLKHLRAEFCIPSKKTVVPEGADVAEPDTACIYLCGNSLGLQPSGVRTLVNEELDVWATHGVTGHFRHPKKRPWVSIDENVIEQTAKIVGASPKEVAIMNSLTANLHFLMVSFYRPTKDRYKILMEAKAFPSDYYAMESQTRFHGYEPDDAIIQMSPRSGEHTLRTEDILDTIEREGDKIALVIFSGVQYYTGQFFELEKIAKAGKAKNCVVGFDLAHAAGNVPLRLHDWGVDFACWCTYKYLNAGPGGIGGAFVHERHARADLPRMSGWWGTDPATRFLMDNVFRPIPGADSYRVSNPNVLAIMSLLGSLNVFSQTSMTDLRAKSLQLTGYLETLLLAIPNRGFKILTPSDPSQRGCQLSLLFEEGLMMKVFEALEREGVIVDERKPDVIRVAPTPLYNTFSDVWQFVNILKTAVVAARIDSADNVSEEARKGFLTS
ncbi:pyridoxal phosphate-dependent transferase [Powellomyces hirtus]|nr:pyridoxal phosphate-dependent transferase [Powellomyces hirtus]